MLRFIFKILSDEYGGLGITRLSLVCAVADDTGDDSQDAVVKIRRLINRRGTSFCDITNWPFLRSDISFDITSSAYTYSGASYLPTTFKKVTAGFLLDGSDRHSLKEVSIQEAHEWGNPNDNSGRPDEFCITRIESGYWEIQFNRLPDATYTIYFEIELQWTDLTADTSEAVVTQDFYDAFVHYCDIARFKQQGDAENYTLFRDEWWNPGKPQDSLLGKILKKLSLPMKNRRAIVDMEMCGRVISTGDVDYNEGNI